MEQNRRGTESSGNGRQVFRTLRYRNFRLFFGGQAISLHGTWIQQIALSWLVYRLTGSAFLLGLVGFVSMIPTFLLSPLAGVLADRVNRRAILITTQILLAVQALVLAGLTLTGAIRAWQILPLAFLGGCVNAFDASTRQAFVLDMVESKENLGNAIALNSLLFNSARMVGPSLAGVLVGLFGEGLCFLINGVSYLAVIAALTAMRVPPSERTVPERKVLHELREGFAYAYRCVPIRAILLFLGLVSLLGMPYTVLMPVFAGDILRGAVSTYGFLMAGIGVGALAGAVFLASRKSVLGLGGWMVRGGVAFGSGLIALSLSRSVPLSFLILVLVGFGMMVQLASANTVLQTIVEERMRGRVMGLYTMAFMGMAPFGSLMAGALAVRIGVPGTLALSGTVCLAGAALFARMLPLLRGIVRPIYIRMGIIPGEDGVSPPDDDGAGCGGGVDEKSASPRQNA